MCLRVKISSSPMLISFLNLIGNEDIEYFGHRVNSSQHRAIEAACTEELSLIQGPPGTGKTYTAALIVRRWMEQPGEVENNKVNVNQ